MARPSKAEEAILLASDNEAAAAYLVKRGEAETSAFSDSISEETEAALLERHDRLIDLRLAEYCFHPATGRALFHRDPTDWALRSLVLSNKKVEKSNPFKTFPEWLFDSDEALKTYLCSITSAETSILFSNQTIDDSFLANVLELGDHWHAMPETSRFVALSNLAYNPKMQNPVDTIIGDNGWGEYLAAKPFNAAWRLVIALDASADSAFHLSNLYDRLAPRCFEPAGILGALPKWFPQNDAEREEEGKANKRGDLSPYQSIRRSAAAMLLQGYHLEQEQLLESEDNAIRCGAYIAGRFKPDEMTSAIARDGWLATASLMQNPNCWRTSEHRDALNVGVRAAASVTFTSAPELAYWEYRRWENKFEAEHPKWFEVEEVDLQPEDKPLTESSTGELVQQVFASSGFKSIGEKVESLAQAQRIHFWLLVVILVILVFRR